MKEITKERIQAEILSCVGLCVNDFSYDKKEVLIVNSINLELLNFLSKLNVNIHYIGQNPKLELENLKVYNLAIELKINQFDLIIDLDSKGVEAYNKLLKPSGILLINLKGLDIEVIKKASFNIKMPFKCEGEQYLFLSNRFHPLADVCVQKIDMINELDYYNIKIHEAMFALPNYQKEALKGIIRN